MAISGPAMCLLEGRKLARKGDREGKHHEGCKPRGDGDAYLPTVEATRCQVPERRQSDDQHHRDARDHYGHRRREVVVVEDVTGATRGGPQFPAHLRHGRLDRGDTEPCQRPHGQRHRLDKHDELDDPGRSGPGLCLDLLPGARCALHEPKATARRGAAIEGVGTSPITPLAGQGAAQRQTCWRSVAPAPGTPTASLQGTNPLRQMCAFVVQASITDRRSTGGQRRADG